MAPRPPLVERILAPVTLRVPPVGTALRVKARVDEVGGNAVAGSIALTGFLSIFPLLLVGIAVVGRIDANQDLAGDVIKQLSLTGSAADTVRTALETARTSQKAASIVGLAGLLWSGLGLVGAIEGGFGTIWQVKGRGIKGKAFGLVWLVGATIAMGASVASTAFLGTLDGRLSLLAYLSLPIALVVDVAVWVWTFVALTNRPLPWRAHLPGAILGGVGFEVLKLIGTIYVPRLVAQSSSLYGPLGVVFALLAWLLLFARLTMFAAALNVVRWEREHGTVSIAIEVPRLDGHAPALATRSGAEVPPEAETEAETTSTELPEATGLGSAPTSTPAQAQAQG